MALSIAEKTALNQMCPAAKKILLGDKIAGIPLVNVVTSTPSASASNIGYLYFDSSAKKLFLITDATTVKELAYV